MGSVHVPLSDAWAVVEAIPRATPAQRRAAIRYLGRRGALDLLPMLDLAVPAHLEDEDDGT